VDGSAPAHDGEGTCAFLIKKTIRARAPRRQTPPDAARESAASRFEMRCLMEYIVRLMRDGELWTWRELDLRTTLVWGSLSHSYG
jgi:hypothetical protein